MTTMMMKMTQSWRWCWLSAEAINEDIHIDNIDKYDQDNIDLDSDSAINHDDDKILQSITVIMTTTNQ